MAGWTNRGKRRMLEWTYDGLAKPATYYTALVTSASAPTADTNTMAELTEITGGGYARKALTLGTSFDTPNQIDASDYGTLQLVDQDWTASGGSLPTTGGARYMVLIDDGAGSAAEVYHYWDLTSDRQVSDTQVLSIQNAELRITE